MSHGFTDWQSLGILPLQDHHPGIPDALRQQVVAARIARMEDPTRAGRGDDLFVEFATDGGNLGTVGDVHPWRFWQTRARGQRGTGSWAQAFATVTVAARSAGGGPTTPRGSDTGAMLAPIGGPRWESDDRYSQQDPGVPRALSQPPRGSLVLAMATTDETQQLHVALGGVDPRLWAPHTSGPSECGTVVCDLQPEREACMDGATRPGQGGRQALLQGAWRVIAMPPAGSAALIPGTNYNGLAWNMSLADRPGVAGFGMIWAKLDASGGQTGGGGPITQLRLSGGSPESIGAENLGTPIGSFGRFQPRRDGAHGVAFLAQIGASGPIHAGHDTDKHRIGTDRDGNPLNAGHISHNAYFYRSADHDGPMLYEGLYPNPGPLPLITRVHLTWDGGLQHPFVGGMRGGMWRWYAEAPMLVPTRTPGSPPPPFTPRDPRTPGGPGTPGPTTPGPAAPGTPRGGRGGGGGGGGPTTPGPGLPGAGPRGPGGPTTPTGGPAGPAGPRGPGTGGSSPPRIPVPTGGGVVGGIGYVRPRGMPGGDDDEQGEPAPGGAPVPGGGDGGGEPTTTPVPDPIDDDPDNPDRIPDDPDAGGAPGSIDEVGQIQGGDHAAWLLHFPHFQGQTGQTWRPQLWRCGQPSFLHSPNWDLDTMRESELRQPQVLAMHAFGAQEQDDWDYVQRPESARARGGTADGGVLLVPPEWEPEDVLGICGHDQVSAAALQVPYFGLGTGVRFAFGLADLTGDIGEGGWDLTQQWNNARSLLLRQRDSGGTWVDAVEHEFESVGPITTFHGAAAVRIPVGGNADRPSLAGGELRVNDETGVSLLEHNQDGSWATVASVQAPAAGDMLYFDGTEWIAIDASGAGTGDVLTWNGTAPEWQAP